MTIREFIRVVWDSKYYVLAAVVLVVGASIFYLSRQQPEYQAAAIVEIGTSVESPSTDQPTVAVNSDPSVVTSREVAVKAAGILGYQGDPQTLADQVEPSFDNGERLTTIAAQATSPGEAVSIANAFAQAYIDQLPTLVEQQVTQLGDRRQALRERLAGVQAEQTGEDDLLSAAEIQAIVQQYQIISNQVSSLQSITQPGVLERSATAAIPLGVQPEIIVAVALLAGLVAGVGLALMRRGLDFTIRSAKEASATARAPVLAEIYSPRSAVRDHKRDGWLPVSSRRASPFTESIRELRTALQVSVNQSDCLVVLVTAADPDTPRSFIAANLAASWALSGRRTVAVAGDMRRPDLQELLPSPADPADDDPSSVRSTIVPNLGLHVITNDRMDPADYLATAEVGQMVADLRRRADVIVIDAPPVLAAADAIILGGLADGAVVIAAVGRTDRAVLKEVADRLRVGNVSVSGIALAGVRGNRRMEYAATYGRRTGRGPTSSGITMEAEVVQPVNGSREPELNEAAAPDRRSGGSVRTAPRSRPRIARTTTPER